MLKNILFITGKSKVDYFSKAAQWCDARFVKRDSIRVYSLKAIRYAFFSLNKDDINDICDFYIQLKNRKNASFFYKLMLSLRARLYFARYYAFFAKQKERFFAIWNGYYLADKAMIKAGDFFGKVPIYFENGLLPDTTTVDIQGVNFANSMPRRAAFYKQLEVPADYDATAKLHTRKPVKNTTNQPIKMAKRYIFIPFQVESDTQIIVYGGWINSMRQLFSEVTQLLSELDEDVVLVFKEHPASHDSYEDLYQLKNARIIFANDNSTEELIVNAEAIVTVNSTVGIEALLFNKKIITLGQAFSSIDGLVLHATNARALKQQLRKLSHWRPDPGLVRNFIWYLNEQYLVKGSWKAPTPMHFLSLKERLQQLVVDH